MKNRLLLPVAAICVLAVATSATVSAQTNLIDFNSYETGALPVGGTSPWNKSGNAAGSIEAVTGGNALHLTGTGGGSLVLDTGHASLNTLTFPSEALNWSFEFQLPSDQTKSYVRLNTGSAAVGKYLAGFSLSGGNFAYLSNPNAAITDNSFTNAAGVSLSEGVWYKVAFEITPGSGSTVAYTVNLTTADNLDNILFSQSVAFSPNALAADAIRMTLSSTDGSDVMFRNISLSAIPEASSVAMMGLGGFLALAACLKPLRKKPLK